MTKLEKPVSRETVILTDNRITARPRDRVAVTLYPWGEIGFRSIGRRKEFTLPLSVAYMKAVEADARQKAREKALKRKKGKVS